MNGPLASADEGMNCVAPTERREDRFLFKDAVDELGAEVIGEEPQRKHGTWPMYSKFIDNILPLFHHLHLDDEAAAQVSRMGKPEAYNFPPDHRATPCVPHRARDRLVHAPWSRARSGLRAHLRTAMELGGQFRAGKHHLG